MSAPAMCRVPLRFIEDHEERELPTPKYTRINRREGLLDLTPCAELAELQSDAEYYADAFGPRETPEINRAARALLVALKERNPKWPATPEEVQS